MHVGTARPPGTQQLLIHLYPPGLLVLPSLMPLPCPQPTLRLPAPPVTLQGRGAVQAVELGPLLPCHPM